MTIGQDNQEIPPIINAKTLVSTEDSSLQQAHQRIVELEGSLANALAELDHQTSVENERMKLEIQLHALRNSASWRITAPLRQADNLRKAARLLFDTVSRQAQARGGFLAAARYYFDMGRREGVEGIKARFRRVQTGAGFSDCVPTDDAYHEWIERYDTLGPAQVAQAMALLDTLIKKPLISVIVPTYNSAPDDLEAMIESVRKQIYPHWELCVADDASTDSSVREVLQAWQAKDKRIKVVYREENGHISEASNSALTVATGEYIALLDHDDILPAHALLLVARYIGMHPAGRLFYSDEDKLDPSGKRTAPYFKPDWNPVLALTQNLFSHLGVYERTLVEEAGGFRKGFEGSQDYDLALRCISIAGAECIVHIPHVLYHWRITSKSTSGGQNRKPYALNAAVRAVNEFLQHSRIMAVVEPIFGDSGLLRVRYATQGRVPKFRSSFPLAMASRCCASVSTVFCRRRSIRTSRSLL